MTARHPRSRVAVAAMLLLSLVLSTAILPARADAQLDVSDSFAGTGPLLGYTTARPEVLPNVGRVDGRYRAELTDNTGNQTLHFHAAQGRLDAKLIAFPFEYIARNIGIGSLEDSQLAPNPPGSTFLFSGIQVHSTDLSAADSAHIVVGHRGGTKFTIEGKNTLNGSSAVNDTGSNSAPDGRADIRIVGTSDGDLVVSWQTPNFGPTANDDWQLYRGTGRLPGPAVDFGSSAYIGLITYAYGTSGLPFVGTADSVSTVGEAPSCAMAFGDVPAVSFYTNAVQWAACVGVTTGTSPTTFSPHNPVTRAQMATFLWRDAGEPAASSSGFVDVPTGAFYTDAVNWLAETGITTGTTPTTFSPHNPVTRAQMATFLWRRAEEPSAPTSAFVDVPTGQYYSEAVDWMAAEGITTGTTASTFSPHSPLTRAQAVTFLWRFNGSPLG